ncbi:DNA-binding response regulator, NarL/FixJ family, contains REC and HTH domains [Nakamurella panacisegetis]|uniref:DNA-binding response regulator, NarL/FixJ family, contains REC and HTH domains n=2 Tax=Nakamurella panacisegetis TaxID=1090615 RepID=A0A1H0QJL6_9ACTN|nr:LuxR C-terminal-related transcriptional regulator [Nakamurella panacisegetis]SDP17255.1 DNA-binding response regulator, NarL/FixJ family, contains REC and HTH domains [Nakamurella panacisegetis]
MNSSTLSADQNSMRRADELPIGAGPLPTQRSPLRDSMTSSLRTATVLLVDPDRATREALQAGLIEVGIGRVIPATSLAAVEELAERGVVGDLALISLLTGHDAGRIINILRTSGWARVLALAPTADIGPVIDAVGAGVNGVLIGRRANPAAANIPSSIHDLSSREIEVIRLVADGRSNKWIGDELNLSALTVKSHLARIGRKLGTGDRAHMVALAMRAGVIS